MNKIAKTFGIFLLTLALIPNVQADKYRVQIKMVTPQSDTGDVVILFKPGKNEDGFSGKAKAMLIGTDLGTNKSLAVILTAVSMEKDVIIEVETMPTRDIIQIITSTGFAP